MEEAGEMALLATVMPLPLLSLLTGGTCMLKRLRFLAEVGDSALD